MPRPEHLLHFSEDPTIEVFHPHVAPTQQVEGAWVWADEDVKSPRYWFPRDCPRATWWPKGRPEGPRVHAIEWTWFDRFVACELYVYRFDAAPFEENPDGGGWRTDQAVVPLGIEPAGPLLDKHRDARIELRLVDDLLALWNDVIQRPGIQFSGIRLKNATPRRADPSIKTDT